MKVITVQIYKEEVTVVGYNMLILMKSFVLASKNYTIANRAFQKGDVYENNSQCILIAHLSEPPINMTFRGTYIVKFNYLQFPPARPKSPVDILFKAMIDRQIIKHNKLAWKTYTVYLFGIRPPLSLYKDVFAVTTTEKDIVKAIGKVIRMFKLPLNHILQVDLGFEGWDEVNKKCKNYENNTN